jgi:hypothetical protein
MRLSQDVDEMDRPRIRPLKDERICGEKVGVDIVLAEALSWASGPSDCGRLRPANHLPKALFIGLASRVR